MYQLQGLDFPPVTLNRSQIKYCWKTIGEMLTSIKLVKIIKILSEEINEFWDKRKFIRKISHYLKR